ncbi:glycoside hydrolase domain-containing protein, partial [Pseudactinotalea sp.]|uniref:glycoside hydrolase domain-containing protein n=1 Tax=Pseudactinotalea sp. TaxID=1926260 RepID=UPI003B3B00DA
NNEPDMDAPWAYHYVGRPDRTAEIVHAAVHQTFGPGAGGLPGNDDSGGLSSWYVWASLGLFPVAGHGVVMLNAPSWRSARLAVANGTLDVATVGFREGLQYVQAATLDGVPHHRAWLTSEELHRGGRLELALGDQPSDWGTSELPPSASSAPHQRRTEDPCPAGS